MSVKKSKTRIFISRRLYGASDASSVCMCVCVCNGYTSVVTHTYKQAMQRSYIVDFFATVTWAFTLFGVSVLCVWAASVPKYQLAKHISYRFCFEISIRNNNNNIRHRHILLLRLILSLFFGRYIYFFLFFFSLCFFVVSILFSLYSNTHIYSHRRIAKLYI